MRTTVEITEPQHRALSALAQQRGVRGFSSIVQEALDAYLASVAPDEVDALLSLEGTFTDADADLATQAIREMRETWRAS
ncbi:hypothetical protein A5733_16570 [Mycobacterium sp. NS-7484]|uniref:hypothetical protein n=1 Tax=unclassified Mycobacterium TaxID=2642494 RepID=UPI000802471A|nr:MULTISPECIES: hypothetical protein [unclassified Mycobacterium]OBG82540.1 hypothetical protein A5699_06070 [Mycobacterium sp. E802]OMB93137.1 hypothetical protein A5733_16570 [Mycobacterium sp. NS-7484]OMC27831.1 hypothetical protein A5740_20820 [Mycobacterium sp. GA-1841]